MSNPAVDFHCASTKLNRCNDVSNGLTPDETELDPEDDEDVLDPVDEPNDFDWIGDDEDAD
jgi:hypothetical protein